MCAIMEATPPYPRYVKLEDLWVARILKGKKVLHRPTLFMLVTSSARDDQQLKGE